jgi:YidC/Oxa1 family membrane protein insertase
MNKNLVAFFAFAMVVMVGWPLLQQQLWPVKPGDDKKVAANKEPLKKDEGNKPEEDKKDAEAKKHDDKVAEVKKDEKKAEAPIPAPKEATPYELGDQDSYLTAVVSNLGAGVRKIVMTKFEAADYLGRRAGKTQEFVQDDPYVSSYRMFHFPDGDANQPNVGLDTALWNVDGGVVKDDDGWTVKFWTLVPKREHLKITKTYRLRPKEYHLQLKIDIQNTSTGKAEFRYQLTGAHGLKIDGEWYTPATSIRTSAIGVVDDRDNLIRTVEDAGVVSKSKEGTPVRVPAGANIWVQYAGVMTQYFASMIVVDQKQSWGDWKAKSSILRSARPTSESNEIKAVLVRIEGDDVTFMKAKDELATARLLPRAKEQMKELGLKEGSKCVVNLSRDPAEPVIHWFRLGQLPREYFDDMIIRVNSDNIPIPANDSVAHEFLLYHGPVKTMLLAQMPEGAKVAPDLVDQYTHRLHLDTLCDYHSDTTLGYLFSKIGWTYLLIQCTKIMHYLLYFLHYLSFGNWGLSIFLLTVVVRGAMFPISRKQALMSQKMQNLAPEIKKLQEKYKGDKAAQAQATMELYRKHKVSPAGGCLPLLMQMPIFMGLYYCLQESVQFRLATFLWMDNLAAPDMLIWWGQSIPWISDPDNLGGMLYLGPYFNLLPIFAVAFMVVQQKLLSPPPQNEEQEMQQKTMQVMMAVMGIFFYKMAAGLCIYFIASSLWGVAERKLLPKKKVTAGPETTTTLAKAMPNARDRRRDRERAKTEPESNMTKLKAWWQRLLESAEKK